MSCMECGEKSVNPYGLEIKPTVICPKCGAKCKTKATKEWTYKEAVYYGVITTFNDFQVIRIFWLSKHCKIGYKANYSCNEVMQHWVSVGNKFVFLSRGTNGMSMYYDLWNFSTLLQVSDYRGYKQNMRYAMQPYKWYPKKKFLPQVKRNGFKGNCYKLPLQLFLHYLINDNVFETLLKTGQTGLIGQYKENAAKIKESWPSLKICLRNKYIIPDMNIWYDHLRLLRFFGKDLRNPHYVCPKSLLLEHNRLIEKKLSIDQRRKAIDAQKEYEKQKGKFFGLRFTDGKIEVKFLETVEEFMIEGQELHHCVFVNEYYKRSDSLILSARIGNKPVETIEVSLSKLAIEQCRGLRNKATKYHKRILSLVESNINQIAQRLSA